MDGSVRLERAFRNVIIVKFMDVVCGTKNLSVTFLPLLTDCVRKSGSSTLLSLATSITASTSVAGIP